MPQAVVYLARVRTLDPEKPLAEALAVRGGQVLAVGSKEAVLAAAKDARVVRLDGATVVPGLADAHAHLHSLGRSLSVLRLGGARTLAEVLERAKAPPAGSYQGEWLVGRGWDQNDWPEQKGAFPSRGPLDALFPQTPVYFTRVDGHAAWVNGEALRRAGVDRRTKDPPGGRILRDGRGEPTGILVDNAMDLVFARIPPPTPEQLERRLTSALERCAQLGLTAVHDAGTDLSTFTLLQRWDAVGALPLRVYALADGQGKDADEFLGRGPFQGRHLTLRAVKFLADGALGSRGAALEAPYADEPGQRGLLLLEPDELEKRARAFATAGFQVAVHAIGDRANALVIALLSRLEKERPNSRHRVEHAQVLALADIPRLAEGGLLASMQPTHATSDMPWAEARLGKGRLAGAYAWRRVLDAKVPLALGSDFPVEDPNPLLGLYAARTRQDAEGNPPGGWLADQQLTGEEALLGFTQGAAYAAFAEGSRGALRPGLQADFVALSVDPVEAAPKELLTAQVLLTVVDGVEVHRAPKLGR